MAWNWGPHKAKRRKSRSVRDFHTAKTEDILIVLWIWKAQSRNCLARFEPCEDTIPTGGHLGVLAAANGPARTLPRKG